MGFDLLLQTALVDLVNLHALMPSPVSYGSIDSSPVARNRSAALRPVSLIAVLSAFVVTVFLVTQNGQRIGDVASVELSEIQYGKLSALETRRDEEAIDNMLKGKVHGAHGVPSSVIAAAQEAARAVKEQQMSAKHTADESLKRQAAIINSRAQNLFEQAVKDQRAEDAADASQMQIAMRSEHAQGFSVSKWDSVQQ